MKSPRGSGFTLVEAAVSSAVLVVVLGALSTAVWLFFRGQSAMSLRRDALVIAAAEASSFGEPGCYPGVGRSERVVESGGRRFLLATEVSETSPGERQLRVSVAVPGGGAVELSRKFYQTAGGD